MKTGAAYIRVSTDMQVELSPDSQLKLIKQYAKQNDIILNKEYIFADDGISGRTAEKRPEFMRMIATAKTTPRPFDVILVWNFSRFARNREDSIVYKSMLRKECGIEVISISEPVGEDKTSILIEALLEAMDEYYSINLAEEVKRGMTEKVSRGGIVAAPPFGYTVKDGIYVPDEREAPVVKMIFEKYLAGEGTRAIWLVAEVTAIFPLEDGSFVCAGKGMDSGAPVITVLTLREGYTENRREIVLAGTEYNIDSRIENAVL